MNIEDQVCSINQAKALVELGVYEPCLFVYFKAPSHSGVVLSSMYMRHIWILTGIPFEDKDVNIIPAYTVAELGRMLPAGYDTMRITGEGWRGYDKDGKDFPDKVFNTEALARAEMLIVLKQSGK
jgi:hypothetical protein